ncbi:TAXI family TRAP transporter solute-binding subunit [Alcaligenaceae bacterium CGII-47]|nr:TAXI family TRAP transporter solute-binding subunit [Alcaligenaceae bacterium CGII-47]
MKTVLDNLMPGKSKKLSLFVLAFISAFLLVSTVNAETRLKIVTASPGGVWYSLGARYAQLLEQNMSDVIVTSAQGGSVPNARQVDAGEADVGIIYADFAQKARAGEAPFRDKLENLRILAAIAPGKLQIAVPEKSDIHNVQDLKNKRINPTKIGWGTRDVAEMVLKEGPGITFDSIKANGGNVFSLDHNDGMSMMVNGQLDALFFLGGAASIIMSLETNPGVRLLPVGGELRDKILNSPANSDKIYFADEITNKMYPSLQQPIPTVSVMQVFIVNKDLPEAVAYEMTKLLYEKGDGLKDLFSGQQDETFNVKDVAKGAVIPMHPGAKRYVEEQGIKVN